MKRFFLYAIVVLLSGLLVWQSWTAHKTWHYLEQETPAQSMGAAPDKVKITINAFVSYTSRPSKDINATLMSVAANQQDIRVIFHIVAGKSAVSYKSAQVAMAASMQNKFIDMHEELMRNEKPLTDVNIRELAQKVKVDPDRLLKDMNDPMIKRNLANEAHAALRLHLHTLPTLILNRKILYVPVNTDDFYSNLSQLIQNARGQK